MEYGSVYLSIQVSYELAVAVQMCGYFCYLKYWSSGTYGHFFYQNVCQAYSHEWSIPTRVPDKNMFIWFRGLRTDAKLWDELYCYTLSPNDAYIYIYILCVWVNKTIIGSDNGLLPVLRQDVIRNNAGL